MRIAVFFVSFCALANAATVCPGYAGYIKWQPAAAGVTTVLCVPATAITPASINLTTNLTTFALKTPALQGPPGPAGPTGATGSTGPAGPGGTTLTPIPGAGIVQLQSGSAIQLAADSAIMLSQATAKSGTPWACASPATGNGTAYSCFTMPVLTQLVRNTWVLLSPGVTNAGPPTLTVDTFNAVPGTGTPLVANSTGAPLAAGTLSASGIYLAVFDGAVWRVEGL